MTHFSRAARAGLAGATLALSACGLLPSAGPSVSTVRSNTDVDIVNVTPALARERAEKDAASRRAAIERAVSDLSQATHHGAFTFAPGDVLHVTLWTISPWPGADSQQGASNVPSPIDLGNYTVSEKGTIDLPYVGPTPVGALGPDDAQRAVARRYASLGILQSPSAKITIASTSQSSVIVTGAIGAPKLIAWTPAGLSLTSALTQALGNGADLVGTTSGRDSDNVATQVTVLRKGASVTLPLEEALARQAALEPGDRVLVKRAPLVRVTVVGGGVRKNGQFGFAHPPTLAEVLASASGLDANLADDHAVFVLEQTPQGERPVLYDFAWNNLQGLIASHSFPIKDGDMIYVAEAPIVPVERAIGILFQLALPVQAVK
ncbi:polysaccharide biosynthesis/export family protein [Burkholderia humptydooensis]|uniref:Polysaccharide biosynthesis/export family protein n=2 Tax=Burkholderia humptydooensis TaxID=430531 RepID=A0A7U4SVA4_9BURK|nr:MULTISPECIES: polysaccharide biosynthesis/export family protein [Burkholderia]AJY40195.1 polysaccharide biosynthesis/export family protein [Burkholderia sp. 2002721687]ALX45631.1 sugar transporter [Burkholderia humptydooensis]EIP86585.1 polysaccharide export protein [Burkholderia humptydooensis MSMB43]QPS47121.1 polysaccharide biosynthesis/export family protein [Burkholderia humptydooensis]